MLRDFAQITANDEIAPGLFLMRIISPGIASNWIPGQFIHILPPIPDNRPLMLRRPISILSSNNNEVDFIYRTVGEGTSLISHMKVGEIVDVIGPLGMGFLDIPANPGKHILVGGGVGAPPMIALARYLHRKGLDVEFYQGARNTPDLILHKALEKEPYKYFSTTEDGSTGHKGLVTQILPDPSSQIAAAYACGPMGMMKAVLKWRGDNRFPYFVSMENKFGCGVGVCLGCSIPTANGYYIRVCRNGPVFDADLIDWKHL
jgi:dihydroorotate dehydrogenase electron transfer subunit